MTRRSSLHRSGEAVARSRDEVIERRRRADPLACSAAIAAAAEQELAATRGLGVVDVLLQDPSVSEVMINGPGEVWVDHGGRPEPSGFVVDDYELTLLIERIVDPLGLQLDRTNPLVDARLDDGSRVHIVVPPLALEGPIVTIRRFAARTLPLSAFGGDDVARVLQALVEARRTILVVGATSTGKTSLLSALGACFHPEERIITIEDTAELRFTGRHIVRLEARPPNREGIGEVTMRTLVRNALRMRPDRLIVGEVRGSEALDLLLALSSGHQGSLATCHADSPTSALRRLEVLAHLGGDQLPFGAIGALISSAMDVIVQLARLGPRRVVTEIVVASDDRTRPPRVLWAAQPRALAS